MECKLAVGQKVVCITEEWKLGGIDPAHWGMAVPKLNCIYTISKIELDDTISMVVLHLSEIVNPPLPSPPWPQNKISAFAAAGFRPLEEKKTDISVFEKLLDKPKVDA